MINSNKICQNWFHSQNTKTASFFLLSFLRTQNFSFALVLRDRQILYFLQFVIINLTVCCEMTPLFSETTKQCSILNWGGAKKFALISKLTWIFNINIFFVNLPLLHFSPICKISENVPIVRLKRKSGKNHHKGCFAFLIKKLTYEYICILLSCRLNHAYIISMQRRSFVYPSLTFLLSLILSLSALCLLLSAGCGSDGCHTYTHTQTSSYTPQTGLILNLHPCTCVSQGFFYWRDFLHQKWGHIRFLLVVL